VFFQNTVNLVFGSLGDKVPKDFSEDRSRMRGAPFGVKTMTAWRQGLGRRRRLRQNRNRGGDRFALRPAHRHSPA
jgi:hypothetical protein